MVIYVTLSNMTSAAPLSVVLNLFSKGTEGKKGRSEGHIWKGYKNYINNPHITLELNQGPPKSEQ